MELNGDRPQEVDESKRWRLTVPIQIYIREDLPHLAGHTCDLSLDGVNIEVGVKLPLKSFIKVEIYFQRGDVFAFIAQEPLKLQGQVMWRKPVESDDHEIWNTGIRFSSINPDQQNLIREEVALLDPI